jgi:hypothetical protein
MQDIQAANPAPLNVSSEYSWSAFDENTERSTNKLKETGSGWRENELNALFEMYKDSCMDAMAIATASQNTTAVQIDAPCMSPMTSSLKSRRDVLMLRCVKASARAASVQITIPWFLANTRQADVSRQTYSTSRMRRCESDERFGSYKILCLRRGASLNHPIAP